MSADLSISNLPRTRSLTIKRLKALGIETYYDLLNYFPLRYEDFSRIKPISHLVLGDKATIKGKIIASGNHYTKSGLKLQKIKIKDHSGIIEIIWFNQPYLLRILTVSKNISVSGTAIFLGNSLSFQSYEFELISDEHSVLKHTGKIIPVYSERQNLSSKLLREKISHVLTVVPTITGLLPEEIIKYNSLISSKEAYQQIHFPESYNLYKKAKDRLSFEELFVITLILAKIKQEIREVEVKFPIKINNKTEELISSFIENLSFVLTSDQNSAIKDILSDFKKPNPMNRFLQGDVGSGKTIVAAVASYAVVLSGYKTLLMAPTEILAKQHYETFNLLFRKRGIQIGLITGSEKINNNPGSMIIIGTHALLNQTSFEKIGLVIIDEQHKFGVKQRALLKSGSNNPHLLTMTATPIPRTVALTLYGDLDISILITMPTGRIPQKTFIVPHEKRQKAYNWIRNKIIKEKQQVFIVCPRIDQSPDEDQLTVKAVKKEFQKIQTTIFPDLRTGLLHGKLTPQDKNKIMEQFKNKSIDILVSTSVVEVGIDIPNATIMMIEGAENFGLAQLHQLRGRVGRSSVQSYCLLFTESTDEDTIDRLTFFSKHTNGFELSEYDFKKRGSGNIFGTQQHGYIKLKIASLSDITLISQVRKSVSYFIHKYNNLSVFPRLEKQINNYDIEHISMD